MPNSKHPLSLRELCIWGVQQIFKDKLAHWITDLSLAAAKGILIYRQRVKEIINECKTLNLLT
jgi:hypothetical protein